MKAAVVLVILSACKIADIHFIGPNGDDDAQTGSGSDAHTIDGMPGNASKVYVADPTGIYRLSRDVMTGALTFGNIPSPQPTYSLASNTTGTHLYGADSNDSTVHDFAINPDGSLGPPASIALGMCIPRDLARHPGGQLVALGCGGAASSGRVMTAPIASGGALGAFTSYMNGTSPTHVAFSPGGSCLFVGDENAPIGTNALLIYTVTAANGLAFLGQGAAPTQPRAVAAISGQVLVAGSGSLRSSPYAEMNCMPGAGAVNYAIGTSPSQILIDPTGTFVLVLGTEVYVFRIVGNTLQMTGGPYLAVASQPITSGAMDPALPNVVYLVRQGGTLQVANLDANGTLTLTSSTTVMGGNPTWIQLVP